MMRPCWNFSLRWPSVGFLAIGYLIWLDAFGISWGFWPRADTIPGVMQYRFHSVWVWATYLDWHAHGWKAFLPVLLIYRPIFIWEGDVFPSNRWTGRDTELAMVVAGYGRYRYQWVLL